jgi:hypothetical protein
MILWALDRARLNEALDSFRTRAGPELWCPTSDELASIVECAFWLSLSPEEGRLPLFSLLCASEGQCAVALRFTRPMDLDRKLLSKVAPSLRGGKLAVCLVDGVLRAWGIALEHEPGLLEVRILAAARLLVAGHGERLLVLAAQSAISLIGRSGCGMQELDLVNAFYGSVDGGLEARRAKLVGMLLAMLVAPMRGHGCGGAILLAAPEDVADVTVHHRLQEATALRDVMLRMEEEKKAGAAPRDLKLFLQGQREHMSPSLRRLTESLGQLTATDGALVLTDDMTVVGYGAKLPVRDVHCERVFQSTVAAEARGEAMKRVELEDLGGMRMQSAARFVYEHHSSMFVVASQDGGLSIVTWYLVSNHLAVIRQAELLVE